jgi:hypothetical protein
MVKPNRIYGIGTAATLADESLWYAANRAAGRDLVALGSLTLLLSVLLAQIGLSGMVYVLAMLIALAGGGALVVLVGLARIRVLRRLPL